MLEHSTNTSQYVAVRFQRDTEMPNYAKIKALNDEFDQLLQVQGPKIGMFCAFIGNWHTFPYRCNRFSSCYN